jgi:hypothetical protein
MITMAELLTFRRYFLLFLLCLVLLGREVRGRLLDQHGVNADPSTQALTQTTTDGASNAVATKALVSVDDGTKSGVHFLAAGLVDLVIGSGAFDECTCNGVSQYFHMSSWTYKVRFYQPVQKT